MFLGLFRRPKEEADKLIYYQRFRRFPLGNPHGGVVFLGVTDCHTSDIGHWFAMTWRGDAPAKERKKQINQHEKEKLLWQLL